MKVTPTLRRRQQGSSMVEWAIVTLIMVLVLFAPIPGQNESALSLLMQAIRGFYANTSLLLSLP
jgi:hypothetical protein